MGLGVGASPGSLQTVEVMFKKVVGYLCKAIRSNTGISSLSLIAVTIGVMSIVTIVVICVCMMIEMIINHTIQSSLEGYASIITAVAALLGAAGIPKAINNYSENKYKGNQYSTSQEIEENETEAI